MRVAASPGEPWPVTANVRAILSWNVPPPRANPDYVPSWGNRPETRVQMTIPASCAPTARSAVAGRAHTWDRTNVNSGGGHNYNFISAGLCIQIAMAG